MSVEQSINDDARRSLVETFGNVLDAVLQDVSTGVSDAFRESFVSRAYMVRDGEPANVVDGLYAVANAIHDLAGVHEETRPAPGRSSDAIRLDIPDELVAPRRRNGRHP